MERLSWKLLRFTGWCLIICFVGLSQSPTLASQREHYKNLRWNFCVEIPPKWNRDEGFNGAGVFVYPPQKDRDKERSGPANNETGKKLLDCYNNGGPKPGS